jgi:hypothetical protein
MQSRPPCPRLSVNETVASEKGKSGIAYVMNSGSLETRLRRMARGAETSVGHESTSGPIWTVNKLHRR